MLLYCTLTLQVQNLNKLADDSIDGGIDTRYAVEFYLLV